MVSKACGCGELNGSSHQSQVQPLVGRGLLECDPLLVKDHVGVTNVCAAGQGGNEHLSLARGRFAGRTIASRQW